MACLTPRGLKGSCQVLPAGLRCFSLSTESPTSREHQSHTVPDGCRLLTILTVDVINLPCVPHSPHWQYSAAHVGDVWPPKDFPFHGASMGWGWSRKMIERELCLEPGYLAALTCCRRWDPRDCPHGLSASYLLITGLRESGKPCSLCS